MNSGEAISPLERLRCLIAGLEGTSPEFWTKVAATVLVVLSLALVHRLIVHLVFKRTENVRARYRWQKSSGYIIVVAGLALAGAVWFAELRAIGTFLGLVSAGMAIALRDLVANFAGWTFILWRRPFELGDRVEIAGVSGDVIDIRLFEFTLMEIGNWVAADQSTGRVYHIPNGKVLGEPLANYTKGFRFLWNELKVRVTFESDWERAKVLLQEIAEKHAHGMTDEAEKIIKESARQYLIIYSKLTPIVYTRVTDWGVLLTVRYLCLPRRRRDTEQAIWEDALRAFKAAENIEFAYPTGRIVSQGAELCGEE